MVYGAARAVELRREPHRAAGQDILILSFRVNEFGEGGNLVQQTPVELRGGSISGGIRDGDEVGLDGEWRDGVVRTRAVTIYKDGNVIGLVRATSVIAKWQIVVAVLMVVAFIAFVIFGVQRVQGSGGPPGAIGSPPTVQANPSALTEPESPTKEQPSTTEGPPPPLPEAAVIERASGPDTGTRAPQAGPDVTVVTDQVVRWVNRSSRVMTLRPTHTSSLER